MKKYKGKVVCTVLVVFALVGVLSVHVLMKSSKAYTIGALSVLSGPFAEIGQDFAYGMRFARDEFAKRTNVEIELRIEDGKAEAKTSVSAFRKLLFEGLTASILVGDNQVPAVAPIVSRQQIPTIATSTANSAFLEYNQPEPWIFRNFASITLCSGSIAKFAIEDLKKQRVGLLYMSGNYGQESKEAFQSVFMKLGGKVVGSEEFQQDSLDVKNLVTKILNEKPDVVFVSGYGMSYCSTMNQVREMGFVGPILTGDSISNPESLKNVKNLEEVYFTNQIFPDTRATSDFKGAFFKRYGRTANLYTAYGYDSFMILAEAICEASGDKRGIRDSLLKMKSKQILLGEISFTKNGDCVVPLVINQMHSNGRQVALKQL